MKIRLKKLKILAKSNDNIIPGLIKCVQSACTLGEMSDALREVYGITLNSHILKIWKYNLIRLTPMVVSSFTFWFIIYKTGLSLDNRDFIFFLSFFFSTAFTNYNCSCFY